MRLIFADILSWHSVQIDFLIFLLIVMIIMGIYDVFFEKQHTIKHNFPVIGRLRYLLEKIGPELRQYIVTNNHEELPFNRSQRTWIYASSKKQNNYEGFGTDKDIYSHGHIFIKPALFPFTKKENLPVDFLPSAKVIGLSHNRRKPFRPCSLVNISAMSFGSLSGNAIAALNQGALKAGCYHNTGEGSLSPYHRHGADVILQIGTAYFGVRDEAGNFSLEKLEKLVEAYPSIKAIEIKLSQGAKPGKGGVLPAAKITKEIAETRGVQMGQDVISPEGHSAFSNITEMVGFIEQIAERTGLPVGIKAAVGQLVMWQELTLLMRKENKGPDFITIDGGEGGTGAAPPAFADNVALPFACAFTSVYKIFQKEGLCDKVVFIASGKLGFPAQALMAIALGADVINIAREAMMSIGCIQAQRCHTNQCPTGIATHNKWLTSGLIPELKAERCNHYIRTLRKEILQITHACGYAHPSQMTMNDIELSVADYHQTQSLKEIFGYEKTPVTFENMDALKVCNFLGGNAAKELKSV